MKTPPFRDLFTYDPDTGVLTWKSRPLSHFHSDAYMKTWNKRWAGKVAGRKATHNKDKNRKQDRAGRPKCIMVNIRSKMLLAHNIIWGMIHGCVPDGMVIDHINGDPWDNRLLNLRPATNSQNGANARLSTRNKTGFKGVYLDRARNLFVAAIRTKGKTTYLGSFHTPQEAHERYCKAATERFGEYAKFR